jgi:uncharacterized membrane protein YphA (DoxX/SURF4 family)
MPLVTFTRLLRADAPSAAVFIRFVMGLVFASEGIQKFVYPEAQGVGRFAKIGIPAPELMGPFVGGVEIVCGTLLLVGLATRLAAVPLVIIMLLALASTKLPILLGHGYWLFAHTFAPKAGLWAFLHESRTDLSMLCGSIFLAIAGADRWSLDRLLQARRNSTAARSR